MFEKGEKHYFWKGGRKKGPGGYIYLLCHGHPRATKDGYVLEHIVVMEKHLARTIGLDEIVHHKNEIKYDNRIENLEVMTRAEHINLHHRIVTQEMKDKIINAWKNVTNNHKILAKMFGISRSSIGLVITEEKRNNESNQ